VFVWFGLGLVVAVLTAMLVSRGRAYRRLFADEHFLEIARAAHGLKAAAIAEPIDVHGAPPNVPGDARFLLTTAGLAVVYTVVKEEQAFIHHLSVSNSNGITANAVGATFVAYVARLVGLPLSKMTFEVGVSTVHHGEVRLDAAEHEALGALPIPEVSPANVAELWRAAMGARSQMSWKRPAV
jgi:hypothetical protein